MKRPSFRPHNPMQTGRRAGEPPAGSLRIRITRRSMKPALLWLCTLCVLVTAVALNLILMFLAEALDDGLQIERVSPLTELLVATGPFGFFPLITSGALAASYYGSMRKSALSFHYAVLCGLLTLAALIGLSVAREVARHHLSLDGGRRGTPTMWIAQSTLSLLLAVMAWRSFRRKLP